MSGADHAIRVSTRAAVVTVAVASRIDAFVSARFSFSRAGASNFTAYRRARSSASGNWPRVRRPGQRALPGSHAHSPWTP